MSRLLPLKHVFFHPKLLIMNSEKVHPKGRWNVTPLLFSMLMMISVSSCEQIEGAIKAVEEVAELPDKLDEFNKQFDAFVDTVHAKSEHWQTVLADSSEAKRELLNLRSEQWQMILENNSNMWQLRFNDKSQEWLQAASEYKDLLGELRTKADSMVQVLKAMENNLPKDARLASLDIERTLNTSIGMATTNFLCATDAMEFSLSSQLEEIQKELKINLSYSPKEDLEQATICSVTPNTLRLTESRETRSSISISGYNLTSSTEFVVYLVQTSGASQQLPSEAIEFRSENEILVHLSSISDSHLNLFQKLRIELSGNLLSEVAINH